MKIRCNYVFLIFRYYQRYTRFASCSESDFASPINGVNLIDYDDAIESQDENEGNDNYESLRTKTADENMHVPSPTATL